MKRFRTAIVTASVTALMGVASVANAGLAHAEPVANCRSTAPARYSYGPGGAEWIQNIRLIAVQRDEWNIDAINCRYEGDKWRQAGGMPATYLGTVRFWDPTQIYRPR
jgi:hypothetical protein